MKLKYKSTYNETKMTIAHELYEDFKFLADYEVKDTVMVRNRNIWVQVGQIIGSILDNIDEKLI